MFTLHPQLHADTVPIGRFDLSLVLMHKDSRFPWCILVPQRENMEEVFHLDQADRMALANESCQLAEVMNDIYSPDSMNIASLGNQVPQLHVHHVARFQKDAAWPGPVWSSGPAQPYQPGVLAERVKKLQFALEGEGFKAYRSN